MSWFETLTGVRESSPEHVRQNLTLQNDTLTSHSNGQSFRCGRLEIPSLAELRPLPQLSPPQGRKIQLREVVGDIQSLHADAQNSNSVFQVASQFNLLEMISPQVTPEDGIGIYEQDFTQGPACAIACGAGTIYRNYFVSLNGQTGQSESNQVDCLQDLGHTLGNSENRLWKMKNGYALATATGLREISDRIESASETERDHLRQLLRIGVHWETQVTHQNSRHHVTQVFCSALPVAYTSHAPELWEPFARLILESAYEATFCAAIINARVSGQNKLYLTLLGGGAFGNSTSWIIDAIRRSVELYQWADLDVAIVSHRTSNPHIQKLVGQVPAVDR